MTDPEPRAPRILVYGSCVARDTVEIVRERVDLRGYVARQSLLSIESDASPHLPGDVELESPFQERMVRDDFAGSLASTLAQHAPEVDLLLWDLADERHGVHRFPDGTIATRSVDTIRSPTLAGLLDDAEHLPFGSDEHFALWRPAAARFVERLQELGLLDRTVVLDVPWAVLTTTGEPSPWSMGVRASDANGRFRRYYEALAALGVRSLAVDADAVHADPAHRWGLAPFHYAPSVYRSLVERLERDHGVVGLAAPTHPASAPSER